MNSNRSQFAYTQDSHPVFNKICFWLITIDILFLPYLSFMAVSASILVVALWLLINYSKITHNREGSIFIIMLLIMFFGTIMCLLYTGHVRLETTFGTALKRFFQYGLCFGAYFFYKDYFSKHLVNLEKIVFYAVAYIAVFAIIYRLFPKEYATFKIAINPADNHTARYLANAVVYRFNYFWTDPNNVSYLIAGLSAWFVTQKKPKMFTKLVLLIMAAFISFCTMSNGGTAMLVAMIIILLIIWMFRIFSSGKIEKRHFIFIIVSSIVLAIILSKTNITEYIYNNYIVNFIARNQFYGNRGSSSGGRIEDLVNSFHYLNPIMLIIGTGNEGFSYEIGHIYWIGMYGVPAYMIFMWLMFRKTPNQKWSQYIWIIPFFVGFTMNIAIGEYKWMAIYLMLLAYSRVSLVFEENTYEDEMRIKNI